MSSGLFRTTIAWVTCNITTRLQYVWYFWHYIQNSVIFDNHSQFHFEQLASTRSSHTNSTAHLWSNKSQHGVQGEQSNDSSHQLVSGYHLNQLLPLCTLLGLEHRGSCPRGVEIGLHIWGEVPWQDVIATNQWQQLLWRGDLTSWHHKVHTAVISYYIKKRLRSS